MDRSIYTFKLGEKEITLKFTWGGIRKLKNLLNADPLTAFAGLKDATDTVDFCLCVIEATSGLKKEEVDALADTVAPGDMINITTGVIKAFNNAFGFDEVGGEADKDTQDSKAA